MPAEQEDAGMGLGKHRFIAGVPGKYSGGSKRDGAEKSFGL